MEKGLNIYYNIEGYKEKEKKFGVVLFSHDERDKYNDFKDNNFKNNNFENNNFDIFVIRHGETDINVSGKQNDPLLNTPINDNGKLQAEKTGKYLKNKIKNKKFKIYSSTSLRAKQTAEIIVKNLNEKYDIIFDDNLVEIDGGKLNGKDENDKIYKELIEVMDNFKNKYDIIDQIKNLNEFDEILYNLFGVEKYENVRKRVKLFLDNINDNCIIITHNGILSVIMEILTNVSVFQSKCVGDMKNGKNCSIMYLQKNENLKLITLPNTEHLK